jgi:hypothetical protein
MKSGTNIMNLNPETLAMMLKFGGAMLGLLLLVWLIALLTPKLAKLIDRLLGLHPRVSAPSPESYKVKDPWMGALNDPAQNPEQNPAQNPEPPQDPEAAQNPAVSEEPPDLETLQSQEAEHKNED